MLIVQKKKRKVTISVFWNAIISVIPIRMIMMINFGFNAALLFDLFSAEKLFLTSLSK